MKNPIRYPIRRCANPACGVITTEEELCVVCQIEAEDKIASSKKQLIMTDELPSLKGPFEKVIRRLASNDTSKNQ